MWPTEEYIWGRQATIVEYIANRPIYELFTGVEWITGSIRFMQWRDKDVTQEDKGNGSSKVLDREGWFYVEKLSQKNCVGAVP